MGSKVLRTAGKYYQIFFCFVQLEVVIDTLPTFRVLSLANSGHYKLLFKLSP